MEVRIMISNNNINKKIQDSLQVFPRGQRTSDALKSPEKIRYCLSFLGHPEKKLPKAIYVAGTNGKGSCCAFLVSLCKTLGFSYGSFTSPHLRFPTERFAFSSGFLEDLLFYEEVLFFQKFSQHHDLHLTFFQVMVLIAIMVFSRKALDFLIWEAGIGARQDATNVLHYLHSSIITSLSLDHESVLGPTLESIAWEKSGVMRPQVPCITASQPQEAMEVLQQEAQRISCDLLLPQDKDFPSFLFQDLSLKGHHQKINALCALKALFPYGYPQGLQPFVHKALSTTSWPGRLTLLETGPFFEASFPQEFFIDGAHNEGGFKALRDFLITQQQESPRSWILILGILNRGKPLEALKILSPFVKEIWIVENFSSEPSYDLMSWEKFIEEVFYKNFTTKKPIRYLFDLRAMEEEIKKEKKEKKEISSYLATGSLYFVGSLLNFPSSS